MIPAAELHKALYATNARFKAAARMLIMSNRASRHEPGSQAPAPADKGTQVCSIQ
jgi:hypothetical protein